MGLDLEPLGKSRPGFEDEWDRLLRRLYADDELSDVEQERLIEISIPSHETLGAPVVGKDKRADEWVLKNKPANDSRSNDEYLESLLGFHVVELVQVDGVPDYSNGSLGYVDSHTFRGQILETCSDLIDNETLEAAWRLVITPEEAKAYGERLLAAAEGEPRKSEPKSWFRRVFGNQPSGAASVEDQREILRSAGKWFVFWGARGHPIWANF